MTMHAGGVASVLAPDTPETRAAARVEHLRAECEEARRRSARENARLGLMLRDPAADLLELARVADSAATAASRLAGFALMLSRAAPAIAPPTDIA